ncbi:MAG: hypothetical protein A3C55_04430 [Gammaproteobacteria bacterium RIFCSPHIGHO2_02_FULL_42_13]|nr:MAG: hypothetical protein A3C55_04430 [Gammaproteobacteria bacterium RIFCSPHIGHO2_02_FULL_42_13]OGT68701.1 MAG: hypothetical protein A3H43_06295 [Gammaproteobacteria bacterium RIFCSPLOWO2_02_FULL_42_9]
MSTTQLQIMRRIGTRSAKAQEYRRLMPELPATPRTVKHALVPNRNRLMIAAGRLFSIITQLRYKPDYEDLPALRGHLLKELQQFQCTAERFGYDVDSIMISRYSLCAGIDDIINKTTWGIKGDWQSMSLLSNLQQGITSDERFFLILDKACRAPQKFIDTIELMYICLNLGFEGKFRDQKYERNRLQQMIDYVYSVIRKSRGEFDRCLSPSIYKTAMPPRRKFPLAGIILTSCLIIIGIYGSMNYLLGIYSNQATQQLQHITNTISTTT